MFHEVTIGPCRLIHADSLDVLPTLTGIDAMVSDPPYGGSRSNHGGMLKDTRPMILNDDSQEVGQAACDWAELNDLPTAVFASPRLPFAGKWRNLIVWDKGAAVAGGGDLKTCLKLSWELIQVARNRDLSHRDGSVWRQTVTPQSFLSHPNQKPLPLLIRLLKTVFVLEETIVDPFMGSGSTGLACIDTDRKFVGIELDPIYFAIAVERIRTGWNLRQSELPFVEQKPPRQFLLPLPGPARDIFSQAD